MTANALLSSLSDEGYQLSLDGDSIRCFPKPSEALRETIKSHKTEIINLLQNPPLCSSSPAGIGAADSLKPIFQTEQERFEITLKTAQELAGMFPEKDPDRLKLSELLALLGKADQAKDKKALGEALSSLSVATVTIYGRRINQEYRAAIWGGRAWSEVKK